MITAGIAAAIADNLGLRKEDMHYPVVASLQAMREPSEAMREAAWKAFEGNGAAFDATEIWQAMIDAALKEMD